MNLFTGLPRRVPSAAMDGLLTAIKTVKQASGHSLTAVESNGPRHALTAPTLELNQDLTANQIIDVLKSQPSREEVSTVLTILDPYSKSRTLDLDIRLPGPVSAQILQLLVSSVIPSHWASLVGDGKTTSNTKTRAALLRCLSSVAGIGSLVARLRSLIASVQASSQQTQGSNNQSAISDILSVFATLLEPTDFLYRTYDDILALNDKIAKQRVAWNEVVSLIASGKVVSTAAEALAVASDVPSSPTHWLADGRQYAKWLGTNISHMISKLDVNGESGWLHVASLTERALSLGYSSSILPEIYVKIFHDQTFHQRLALLLDNLRLSAQVNILQLIILDLPVRYPSIRQCDFLSDPETHPEIVSATAAVLSIIIGDRSHFKDEITNWLTKGRFATTFPTTIDRALIATYNNKDDALKSLLIRSLENFADKFAINHNSDREHDANAQVILLVAARLHRLDPSQIKEVGHSGAFLSSISNRLASSSNRARIMGMIVGTGISELMEEPGNSLKFDLEEMKSAEAQWYLSLVRAKDEVGSFETLKHLLNPADLNSAQARETQKPKSKSRPQKIVEVVSDDEEDESEDEDLIPYEKPDEDVDDDDEDPTLVQRNKPTAPVYVRDLITYLRDNENVERYHLAITTAPSLIRRKIGFGTELAEQIEELALTIVGLQNDNNHPQFHECRLQSMITLIVSQPLKMGRWFTAIFFDGDLSQVQRSAVLTALGLGAREVAGNGEEDAKSLNLPTLQDTSFPSKRLSPALDAMFQQDSKENRNSPIATLTNEMSKTSLQPLAANAADTITGPNALKVRTFSSRMEVEKKRQQRDAQRRKNVTKDLYKVLAEEFFFPLISRFTVVMLQYSSSSISSYNPFTVPHLLTLFLQTLSLILSTSGPHSPFLPGLTHETLSLLLSLHTSPISTDPTVTAALLTLLLAAIDLNIASGSNGEERLVTEYASKVIELREWASQVFDNTPAGSGIASSTAPVDTQDQVRTLAAGIMVRVGEITERYQGRLMGINSGFQY
ncbi:hypothetical protein N7478_010318 [Penicillium angulare]|uniref:uncharacterized protein n=1 Tax=Penicillium angulare TaxID=116970 RepID=UPI002540FE41|nr:uncharacterized protein N7478_010318 [Penicillium angulare]KAJ5267510.1 hypothetical protein N7478_010318 [Penicillium angulare]